MLEISLVRLQKLSLQTTNKHIKEKAPISVFFCCVFAQFWNDNEFFSCFFRLFGLKRSVFVVAAVLGF